MEGAWKNCSQINVLTVNLTFKDCKNNSFLFLFLSTEQPKGKTKSPKKEHSAPSKKQVKAKTEQAKEEVGAASTKKAAPGKKEEKTSKTVEQEIKEEKSGRTSSVMKDKELIKGKEVKVPAPIKEKDTFFS
uniref:Triadin-like isoform X3 n=1 Tax=Castor canadensis TaxID=51338 RepID=A0A8B7WDB6_CASCN|nr:triadin-like isoform X3 [Castor canadensis]